MSTRAPRASASEQSRAEQRRVSTGGGDVLPCGAGWAVARGTRRPLFMGMLVSGGSNVLPPDTRIAMNNESKRACPQSILYSTAM